MIEKYVLPYFETRSVKRLSDLNRQNILTWMNYLWEHGKLPEYVPPETKGGESKRGTRKFFQKLSPTSQNKVRVAFFVALQWAVDMGLLPYHPGQGVRRVKEERPSRPFFELDELGLLFDKWKEALGPIEKGKSQTERIAYAACLLAATTGARMGEVRGLLIKNVHLDKGYLDIVTNYVAGDGLKVMMKAAGISGGQTFHSFRHTYISHLRGVVPEAKLRAIV